jgi:hypothetical protein
VGIFLSVLGVIFGAVVDVLLWLGITKIFRGAFRFLGKLTHRWIPGVDNPNEDELVMAGVTSFLIMLFVAFFVFIGFQIYVGVKSTI